jgi:hypothetical protein
VTAAVRGHFELFQEMLYHRVVRLHVPAAALRCVLEHLLRTDGFIDGSRWDALGAVVHMFADERSPLHHQLDISTVARLMRACVRTEDDDNTRDTAEYLCCVLVRDDERQQLLQAVSKAYAEVGCDALPGWLTSMITPV